MDIRNRSFRPGALSTVNLSRTMQH